MKWQRVTEREREREREREKSQKERERGGTLGSACLTKDMEEASLLCHVVWSHQWPSKSPASATHTQSQHTHIQQTAEVVCEDKGNRDMWGKEKLNSLSHTVKRISHTHTYTHTYCTLIVILITVFMQLNYDNSGKEQENQWLAPANCNKTTEEVKHLHCSKKLGWSRYLLRLTNKIWKDLGTGL